MKLIFAQGNPGEQYSRSRHNIGWMVLDAWARQHQLTFSPRPKFQADIASFSYQGKKILLAKPTTFYNDTGLSARSLVDFYKLAPEQDFLVIHDDLVLPLGTLRTRHKGSDAGNNGIKSLNAHLGQNYWRLRVGTWSQLRETAGDINFVLGAFHQNEQTELNETIIPKCLEIIDEFVAGTPQETSYHLLKSPST